MSFVWHLHQMQHFAYLDAMDATVSGAAADNLRADLRTLKTGALDVPGADPVDGPDMIGLRAGLCRTKCSCASVDVSDDSDDISPSCAVSSDGLDSAFLGVSTSLLSVASLRLGFLPLVLWCLDTTTALRTWRGVATTSVAVRTTDEFLAAEAEAGLAESGLRVEIVRLARSLPPRFSKRSVSFSKSFS